MLSLSEDALPESDEEYSDSLNFDMSKKSSGTKKGSKKRPNTSHKKSPIDSVIDGNDIFVDESVMIPLGTKVCCEYSRARYAI